MLDARRTWHIALLAAAPVAVITPLGAQQSPRGFGECVPVAERGARDVGCFIITEQQVGSFGSRPLFWHVRRLGDRDVVTGPAMSGPARGTVITAFGQNWLVTLGDSTALAGTGRDEAVIGPLPVTPDVRYAALYMEASMRPGMKSAIHRHSGPEAWYTLAGETCLETPTGAMTGRANGPPVIVPGGPPMQLTATGTEIRKSIVLILHDASKPPTTMEHEWKPRGLCRAPTQ